MGGVKCFLFYWGGGFNGDKSYSKTKLVCGIQFLIVLIFTEDCIILIWYNCDFLFLFL